MNTALDRVLDLHRLVTDTRCGAISMPLIHHHGTETDSRPGPKRSLTCTKVPGHEGVHRDCICCYRFQTFEDWQVVGRKPRTFDVCSQCRDLWPCATIKAIQEVDQ